MKNVGILILIAAFFLIMGLGAFGIGPAAPLAGPIHQGLTFVLSGGN